MGQSAGQERPGRMLCAEKRLRQAVFSVGSNCAQLHLIQAHSSQSSGFAQTLANEGLSRLEEGRENGFLNRWSGI